MHELIQLGKNTFYIECLSRMGIYRLDENNVCIIYTGADHDSVDKLLEYLDQNHWTPKMVLNTHSHADHIFGNAVLESMGCKCYCSGIENVFIRNTFLEPSFMYGADTFDAIETNTYMAKPSHSEELTQEILPAGFAFRRLDGHSFAMSAIKTPDDIWFLGDAVVSDGLLSRYHLTFLVDVEKYLKSLDELDTFTGALFVPAHSKPKTDSRPLVQKNRENTMEIIDLIGQLCRTPLSQEQLQKAIFDHYGRHMTVPQYVLSGSIIRTYLSYMRSHGLVEYIIENNMVKWHTL